MNSISLNNYNQDNNNNNNNINYGIEEDDENSAYKKILVQQENLLDSDGVLKFKKQFPKGLFGIMEEFEFETTIESINQDIRKNLTKRNYLYIGALVIGLLCIVYAGLKSGEVKSKEEKIKPSLIVAIIAGLLFFIFGIIGCATSIYSTSTFSNRNNTKKLEKTLEKISKHFESRQITFKLRSDIVEEIMDEDSIDKNNYISNKAYRNTIIYSMNGKFLRSESIHYIEIIVPKVNQNLNNKIILNMV